MGGVKRETRNAGRGLREWDYITLSEPRIVSSLIKNRSKLDQSFYPSLTSNLTNVSADITSGVFLFSEAIICTYIDLEKQIETCGLSSGERLIVNQIMLGYSFADLEDMFGKTRQTYEKQFERAVWKICKQNDSNWMRVYKKSLPN